jgi:integrase
LSIAAGTSGTAATCGRAGPAVAAASASSRTASGGVLLGQPGEAEHQLEQLWRHDGIAVREKVLWRFLYETAGRATEALSINVEDLDVDNKRVRVRSKGGDLDWLHFQTGSARLLPRLIAGAHPWAAVPRPAGPD